MFNAPKDIQQNFLNALEAGSAAFKWETAINRYYVGNSLLYDTNIGGREIHIETRQQINGTVLWVVKMQCWVLGKDNQYHYEVLPSDRDDDFIENTRFANPEKALAMLLLHEKNPAGKTTLTIPPLKKRQERSGLVYVMAEEICEFKTFQDWVNKASGKLTGFSRSEKIICIDQHGNACNSGKDFQYARDNNLFPVTAHRLIKSGEENHG